MPTPKTWTDRAADILLDERNKRYLGMTDSSGSPCECGNGCEMPHRHIPLNAVAVDPSGLEPGSNAEADFWYRRGYSDAVAQDNTGLRAARPGERRFRDLLERERHDVGMLARHVAEMYDSVSGGLVSKPNTLPSEVISIVEERLSEAYDEGYRDALASKDSGSSDPEPTPPASDHPRTYSLVGGGLDMFLVTDDESGMRIGYARKIGGPLTKPANEGADR